MASIYVGRDNTIKKICEILLARVLQRHDFSDNEAGVFLFFTYLCADQIETSTPPRPGKPRAFDHFLCPGVGNLICKVLPVVGI